MGRKNERGEGKLGGLILLLVLLAAGLAAWNIVPVYFDHYDFIDKVNEICRDSTTTTTRIAQLRRGRERSSRGCIDAPQGRDADDRAIAATTTARDASGLQDTFSSATGGPAILSSTTSARSQVLPGCTTERLDQFNFRRC